jgi:hypothetical protein
MSAMMHQMNQLDLAAAAPPTYLTKRIVKAGHAASLTGTRPARRQSQGMGSCAELSAHDVMTKYLVGQHDNEYTVLVTRHICFRRILPMRSH